jgi:hypothetical protein
MATPNEDQGGAGVDEGVNAESQAEWLTEQAILGGKILDEIRASLAKRNLPAVAYLMALYVEYAATRDELVGHFGEKRVRNLEEGFRTLADMGPALTSRARRRNSMYA